MIDSTLYTETGIIRSGLQIEPDIKVKTHEDVSAGLTGLINSVGSFRGDGFELMNVKLEP